MKTFRRRQHDPHPAHEGSTVKNVDLIAGLTILQPYYDGADGYNLGAEHDQIYAYATDRPLSPEDVAKMRDLGWFQPDQDSDEDPPPYDPEDGWSAFT
jgi:hypothetical protein